LLLGLSVPSAATTTVTVAAAAIVAAASARVCHLLHVLQLRAPLGAVRVREGQADNDDCAAEAVREVDAL
jgi:hypothetical protein